MFLAGGAEEQVAVWEQVLCAGALGVGAGWGERRFLLGLVEGWRRGRDMVEGVAGGAMQVGLTLGTGWVMEGNTLGTMIGLDGMLCGGPWG